MAKRHFPVHPNLDQLKHQAKDLLRLFKQGDSDTLGEFEEFHPRFSQLTQAKLADAQLVLARAYGISSWPRLVRACRMTDAIHRDDVSTVRELITEHPELLLEDARGVPGNWGPPLSYAANLGRDRVIRFLAAAGAGDVQHAFDRACLQGKVESAKWLLEHGAMLERGIVMGPCETQNGDGLELLLELGAELCDDMGDQLAPVALVLETYSRNPAGKHRCLDLLVKQGVELPDTPVMALHRGRIDLLERHRQRDPELLTRRFSYRDIYPLELGCHKDNSLGLHGTPIGESTLLHMCVDFDEMNVACWLLENGADANVKANTDHEGFGGHTPLFNAAVSQAHVCGRQRDAAMAKLLLSCGADVSARASIRKRLRFVDDESMHYYRDVTPLAYARAFYEKRWTCKAVVQLLVEHAAT